MAERCIVVFTYGLVLVPNDKKKMNLSKSSRLEKKVNMKSISRRTYRLGKRLGAGTYGVVYEVTRDDGEPFALKRFQRNGSRELDLGILREISILKMLQGNSEGVINLVDLVLSPKITGIIMPKYNMDLHKAITTNCLTKRQKILIVYKLLKALAFLETNGIIHRDIKPENIMLDAKMRPVLVDFTLAKVFSGSSNEGTHTSRIATVTYRAPEVIAKEPYGFPSDAWSLGVVLYELYTGGQLPVHKDSDAINFLCTQIPKFRDSPLGNMVKGLLCLDPTERLTPKDALASDMFHCDYSPPDILWQHRGQVEVSNQIKELCEFYRTDKQVTGWAAQTYVDKSGARMAPESAVALACKFYETDLREPPGLADYGGDEARILRKMGYNLYV